MTDQNSIPKATELFVIAGGISSEETHVDFNVLNETVVTWSLSDEPELPTTPSFYTRRISDVRQILRLKDRVKALYSENKKLHALLEPKG